MQKQFFVLAPVEVVKVTSQNLDEVAKWCGGVVGETESRRVQGRMDKYVSVPTPKDTNLSWAFPGMFVTKRLVITVKNELVTTYAVFRREYFDKNYFENPVQALDATWEREKAERTRPKKSVEVDVVTSVREAMQEAVRAAEERAEKAEAALRKMEEMNEAPDADDTTYEEARTDSDKAFDDAVTG